SDVAELERVPDGHGHSSSIRLIDQPIIDPLLPVALHFDRVDEVLVQLSRNYLHDADDLSSHDSDRELLAVQKLLHQHGTVLRYPRHGGIQLPLVAADRSRRDAHRGTFSGRLHKEGISQSPDPRPSTRDYPGRGG